MARVVIPQYPHHVTQRGNRRQRTFFSDEDYRTYLDLVADARGAAKIEIWAYCLMPNHVHMVVVPEDADGLALFSREAHRRYTELNPLRAGLCHRPDDWPWSSVHAHLRGTDDKIVNVAPMFERVSDWNAYLSVAEPKPVLDSIRSHARTGRPVGDDAFIDRLAALTGRRLRKGLPGRRPVDK